MSGPRRKLTPDQEALVCQRYQAGETMAEIAPDFGVNGVTVLNTLKRYDVQRRRATLRSHIRGPLHGSWRGGRSHHDDGYYRVRVYEGDPFISMATGRDRQILEHRYVMSQHLGRPLLVSEEVHHLNGVRHDNRIENLELWVRSQPAGQRPEDLVAWAREILERYA